MRIQNAALAVFCLLPICLSAQWLHLKTPGIPRTADGKPELAAPAPRTSDGKPDLSGMWRPGPPAGPVPYVVDLIQELQDEAIFKPAAEALFQKRLSDYGQDWPPRHCLPFGPAGALNGIFRFIQSPTVIAMLFNSEVGDDYRQIFLDGRELPKDPDPTWRGYSVGHWEQNTLVVETAGFNDRSWLDMAGHPHSENLRVTEKFQRLDFGHMQFEITFDDPETMTRPLVVQSVKNYAADTEMQEGVCENEQDARHVLPAAKRDVKLSAAVLARYAGTYDSPPGPPGAARQPMTVSLVNGQLYVGPLPLVPQSETSFVWFDGSPWDFSLDAGGAVTGVTRTFSEGRAGFFRKR